jgi:hypothetical protein
METFEQSCSIGDELQRIVIETDGTGDRVLIDGRCEFVGAMNNCPDPLKTFRALRGPLSRLLKRGPAVLHHPKGHHPAAAAFN